MGVIQGVLLLPLPNIRKWKFVNAVIHVGTNDINNKDSSKSLPLLENQRKIAEKCFSYGVENVFISSVVYNKRSNSYFLERVNAQIAKFCKEDNYGFIDHSNINSSHLYYDGLHLLESGKIILTNNVITCLNTFSLSLYAIQTNSEYMVSICTSENCGNVQHDLQMLRNERLKFNKNPLLGYLNINSLRNKIIDLKEIIQYYFILSETKVDSSFLSV